MWSNGATGDGDHAYDVPTCRRAACPIRAGVIRRLLADSLPVEQRAIVNWSVPAGCSECAVEVIEADDRICAARRFRS